MAFGIRRYLSVTLRRLAPPAYPYFEDNRSLMYAVIIHLATPATKR